jgi:hypothetical protein
LNGPVNAYFNESNVICDNFDANCAASGGNNAEHACRAATLGWGVVKFLQESIGKKFTGELRHERGRDVQGPRQVSTGCRSLRAEPCQNR